MSINIVIFLATCLMAVVLAEPRIYNPRPEIPPLDCRTDCIGIACFEEPKNCLHGIYHDLCGYPNCKKTPGLDCQDHKECAGATECKCLRCTGCYLDKETGDRTCYENTNFADCIMRPKYGRNQLSKFI